MPMKWKKTVGHPTEDGMRWQESVEFLRSPRGFGFLLERHALDCPCTTCVDNQWNRTFIHTPQCLAKNAWVRIGWYRGGYRYYLRFLRGVWRRLPFAVFHNLSRVFA
jgi:hypothetical protein